MGGPPWCVSWFSLVSDTQSRHLGGYEASPRHRPSAAGHRIGQLGAGQLPGFCVFLYDVPQGRHRVAWGEGRSRLLGPAPLPWLLSLFSALCGHAVLLGAVSACLAPSSRSPWGGQRLLGPHLPVSAPRAAASVPAQTSRRAVAGTRQVLSGKPAGRCGAEGLHFGRLISMLELVLGKLKTHRCYARGTWLPCHSSNKLLRREGQWTQNGTSAETPIVMKSV